MKLTSLSKLAVVTLLGLGATLPVHADTVDLWSAAGGAWTAANQPNWTNGTGGILNPDAASDFGADLTASGANSGGIYGSYYYTLFSVPTFTLSTSNVLSDIRTVSLTLVTTSIFSSSSAALNFNGIQSASSFSAVPTGVVEMGQSYTLYTWNFDVSSLGAASAFSLTWTTPSAHTAYTSMSLIQAVPEPHEYALGVAALLGMVIVVRRRRAVAIG